MAHAEEEVEEMTALAGALVLNLGTLSERWIAAMFKAAHKARQQQVPVLLDPVGAGATSLRTDTARRLLSETKLSVVRGNASEILALAGGNTRGRAPTRFDCWTRSMKSTPSTCAGWPDWI